MNTWQLCPKCNGTGQTWNNSGLNISTGFCDLCNGTKIISIITGQPPISIPTANTNLTDK